MPLDSCGLPKKAAAGPTCGHVLQDHFGELGYSHSALSRAKTALRKAEHIDYKQEDKQYWWYAVGFEALAAYRGAMRHGLSNLLTMYSPGESHAPPVCVLAVDAFTQLC